MILVIGTNLPRTLGKGQLVGAEPNLCAAGSLNAQLIAAFTAKKGYK
jgi:hypothetical protein